ncbi:cation channel sperm-associated auxiliary subunit zeta [Erinaceus europaeus]|uniref:Cation channel sperm-associated auxiliary subunit zeta n=1 Tax=Erinaceus europaeus TaxID=9365 RepID=A0ABM3WVY3_ERIEU|nr:cation channel sperm-associated auxiliary subunit zeta [Erinaceus europaeus]
MAEKPPENEDSRPPRGPSVPDIRNLWTISSLSQMNPADRVPAAYQDRPGPSSDTQSQAGHDSEVDWEEFRDPESFSDSDVDELDERTMLRLRLRLRRGSSMSSHLGQEKVSKMEQDISSSLSSISFSKHAPHQAYWVEQLNRLPLPLGELMESEVLEILTKALKSYKKGIGPNHFLTLELERHIQELRRRRTRKLRALAK